MTSEDAGLWCEVDAAVPPGRAALFLDRDGVIVTDTHYLCRVEDMRMIAGAAAAIARCNRLSIPVVVVTNQAGIGRGYYGWDAFHAVQGALKAALAAGGAQSSLAQTQSGHDRRGRTPPTARPAALVDRRRPRP
jgi:D-glycero-D-manno-heptose 1,7-bisphosphate phosphatase